MLAIKARFSPFFSKIYKIKIKSVAYSFQGGHIGQLDFCNWQADDSTTGISITLRQVY